MTILLDAALSYVASGFKVFPVKIDKTPYTPHGLKDAVQTQIGVNDLWSKYPEAGIGLVTDGLVVIDFDKKSGGHQSKKDIEIKYGKLPTTRTHRTGGGGLHFIYRNPNGTSIKNTVCLSGYKGVDIRANGGYIVVPPSPHDSGRKYEILDNSPVTPAPEWLMELIKTRTIDTSIILPGETIPSGQRNATLTRLAGVMRRKGMTQMAIEAALLATNHDQCDPPLTDNDVRTIAKSVSRYNPDESLTNLENTDILDNSLTNNNDTDTTDKVDTTDSVDMVDNEFNAPRGRAIWRLVDTWLADHQGERFDLDTICRHLDLKLREDRHAVVKKLSYELNRKKLEKSDKIYTMVNNSCTYINWVNAEIGERVNIKWPYGIVDGTRFGFDGRTTVSPGDIIVIVGVSNMGKTAMCLNILWNNMDSMPCTLMGNEYTPAKFKRRVANMTWANPLNADGTPKFELIERREGWKDIIRPNNLNIIDWINMADSFFSIGKVIEGIQSKLGKGVAVIALQKDEAKKLGIGGHFSVDLASLYLAIDFGRLTIVKVKEWHDFNSNGKSYGFDIINSGTTFNNIRLLKKCVQCWGLGAYKGSKCTVCNGSGYVDDI